MLEFSEKIKDLGQIRLNQPKSFTVQVTNPSGVDVAITSVKRGCGKCTQARMEVDKIPAKGSATLFVVFTPDSTGINRKSVTINGDSIFTFQAKVV